LGCALSEIFSWPFPFVRCVHRGNKIVIVTVSQLKETNMIIGTFVYDRETDRFSGDISTLHFQFSPVEITPIDKSGEKGPDYRLTSDTAHGHVELGAAWKRTSDQGRAFISVSLDGPLLNGPLNAALFRSEQGDTASLVWSRPKAKAQAGVAVDKGKMKPKPRKAA
jgi:uncharacterized protein (DUF736 family)